MSRDFVSGNLQGFNCRRNNWFSSRRFLFRRSGYGDQLRIYIEARAKKMKLKQIFVLTTRTAHWFIERGFVESSVDALPAARREVYNLQRRSKVLVKML